MKDTVNPNGKKWEFDEEVTKVFGDMLSRSIPNYDTMRELCFMVGRNFVRENGIVSDIGCSNGLASDKFVNAFPNVKFYLSDVSEPMLDACRKKYEGNENVVVLNHDLRNGVPMKGNDLVIASLTLQFTPIEYRWNILQSIYDSLNPGGALILVEKILGSNAHIDNILVNEYYNIKRENGYSEELIQNKRKSLEGVLVPLTSDFNEHLLTMCGFKEIDCFWRCLNFCAWVAIK
jgi:tRNA (cmo5U34)-methyltransferase